MDGFLDLELDNPGEYRFVYFDEKGNVLGETGFDPIFEHDIGESKPITLDLDPFLLRIPDLDNTSKLVLMHGTKVLAEKVFSTNLPVVKVIYPNGGEKFSTADEINVKWESSDSDKDELTHTILISLDDGEKWNPLVISIEGSEYSFDVPAGIDSNSVLIKVIANDGINNVEDTSDSVFSITYMENGTQPPLLSDTDKDGIVDEKDNCPKTYNPVQKDTDDDGIGDACDSTPPTKDGDTITSTKIIIKSDKEKYSLEDKIIITVTDQNANLDHQRLDSLMISIANVPIKLEETGTNTGIFEMEMNINKFTSSPQGYLEVTRTFESGGQTKTESLKVKVGEHEIIKEKPPIEPKEESKSKLPPKVPNTTSLTEYGMLRVDKPKFVVTEDMGTKTITISGIVDDYREGYRIILTITKPDNTTEEMKTVANKDGEFNSLLLLDINMPSGFYEVSAEYGDFELGTVSFNVVTEMVPEWIKSNARWWSEGQIDDSEFVNGIQYMIKEDIIIIDKVSAPVNPRDESIPYWIKNNAEWWANGLIPEKDFVAGLQYLIEKGIIQVS